MLISIEGIEGTGKSTISKLLSEHLTKNNIDHILTKEPGSEYVKVCQKIRGLLLDPENQMTSKTEFFLYLADRAEHVERCIKPAILKHKWVIADRFIDSTLVYQGIARGLGVENIKAYVDYAAGGLIPDLTVILDLPVAIGLARAKTTNTEFEGGDRIEQESLTFHDKLRRGFLDLAKTSDRYLIVDADQTQNQILREITNYLMMRYK